LRRAVMQVRAIRRLPRVFSAPEVQALLNACARRLDRLLVSLLYESGMRIGQVLGLRRADIRSYDGEIEIVPRTNSNGALAKARSPYTVHVLSFHRVQQPWLRKTVKAYIRYCLPIYSEGTCRTRLQSLTCFSEFLMQERRRGGAKAITRGIGNSSTTGLQIREENSLSSKSLKGSRWQNLWRG
jgi:integrase